MSDIIDLAAERARRDGPDAGCVAIGPEGDRYLLFVVDFGFEGRAFSVELWARDWAEAERRVVALRATAELAGQVVAREPL